MRYDGSGPGRQLAWSDGMTTRIDGDFTTCSVAVQRSW